jgi:diaminopimelate epimerase
MDLPQVRIEAAAGVLEAYRDGEMRVTVDMGPPRLGWREIPLAWEMDTREVALKFDPELGAPGCVSMGNPHAVFFVETLDQALVDRAGPLIERHWLFPQRVNVGFAQIQGRNRIRLKVWERGVGPTQACGTGACAALVAASRRGLVERRAVVELDGGELFIDWSETDDRVRMTGPVSVDDVGFLPELEMLT